MKSNKYQSRFYRQWPESSGLVSFDVRVAESDLRIRAPLDLSAPARDALLTYRGQLETYIAVHPDFLASLVPVDIEPLAPRIVRDMAAAAAACGVGPMAAVAGAVADRVGADLLKLTDQVIIENGGDIFMAGGGDRTVALYAGKQLPAMRIRVPSGRVPCGICTSSGNLGHSLSFGKADSVTIMAPSAALADAVASAVANRVQSAADIEPCLAFGMGFEGVWGLVITVEKNIGIQGDIQLVE